MEVTLFLAGLRFRFISEAELNMDPELADFIIHTSEESDVTVMIRQDWDRFPLPNTMQLGQDMICCYYQDGDMWYCLTRGRTGEPVACAMYGSDCRETLCVLNKKPFLQPPGNLGSILRMIPMRAIFQHFHVVFLHASRICCNGRAILFAASSGTGKTTQARLWNEFRNAEILCNDRTLLRKVEGIWCSYGYPLDGSDPVRSNVVLPLGAVVLLKQGVENGVEQLSPGEAVSLLMGQAVIDVWNPDARKSAMEDMLSMLEDIPIYRLTCTPELQAVETLEATLKKDGVISFE